MEQTSNVPPDLNRVYKLLGIPENTVYNTLPDREQKFVYKCYVSLYPPSCAQNINRGNANIIRFAENGLYACLRYAIESGYSVAGGNGEFALVSACYNGYYPIAELLLKNGVNPNATGGKGIILASQKNYTPIVNLLLKYGANPNTAYVFGGSVDDVDVYSDEMYAPEGVPGQVMYPLAEAVRKGSYTVTRALIKKGANLGVVVAPVYSTDGDKISKEPLVEVIENNDLDLLSYLIERGILQGASELPLYETAVEKGYTTVVELLYMNEFYADPDELLINAIIKDRYPIVRFLVGKGVNVYKSDNLPLVTAAKYGNPSLRIIVEADRQKVFKGKNGNKALKSAAIKGRYSNVLTLLERGIGDKEGIQSALYESIEGTIDFRGDTFTTSPQPSIIGLLASYLE